jgi:hypothetical protein
MNRELHESHSQYGKGEEEREISLPLPRIEYWSFSQRPINLLTKILTFFALKRFLSAINIRFS